MKNFLGATLLTGTLAVLPSANSAGHGEMALMLAQKHQDPIICPVDPSRSILACQKSTEDRVAIITDGSCVKGYVVRLDGSSVVGTVLRGDYTIIKSNDGSVSETGTIQVGSAVYDSNICKNLVTDALSGVLNENSKFIPQVLGKGWEKL